MKSARLCSEVFRRYQAISRASMHLRDACQPTPTSSTYSSPLTHVFNLSLNVADRLRYDGAQFTTCGNVEHAVYADVGDQLEPAVIMLELACCCQSRTFA